MENNSLLKKNLIYENNLDNFTSLPTLINVYEKKFLSDCKLLNNSTKTEFSSHKILLCLHSKFFYEVITELEKAAIQSNNNTSDNLVIPLTNRVETITKNDISTDAEMELILKFIYNNGDFSKISKDITASNSLGFLSRCKSLGMENLGEKVSDHITSNFLTKQNSLKIYIDSLKLEDKRLQEKTLKLITKNYTDLNKTLSDVECFLEFSFETFLNFVTQDDLVMETEKDISELILNYIKSRRNIPENSPIHSNFLIDTEINKEKENIIKVEKIENREEEKSKPNDNEEKEEESQQMQESKEEDEDSEEEEGVESEEDKGKEDTNPNYNLRENKLKSKENVIKNVVEKWNNRVAQLKNKFEKRKLTFEEEKKLIESIRFSHLSHSDLISLSIDPIMTQYKDSILLGLSFRLNAYENTNKLENLDKNINYNPRKYIKDQNIYLGNYSRKNKSKPMNSSNISTRNRSDEKNIISSNQNQFANFRNMNNNIQKLRYNENELYNSQNIFNFKDSEGNQRTQNHLRLKSNFNYEPLLEFNYNYDFDEDGVFYYLGTLGKTTSYKNPHLIQQAKAFCSSLGKGNISDLIGRDLVNLRTLNEPFSFFGVDLGEDRYLIPSAYTIKNRNSSSHVMFNWVLEGSNDKKNFEILDSRNFKSNDLEVDSKFERDRCQLKMPGCTSTWFVNKNNNQKNPKGFRYFIIKQTDKNSSGSYNLALSGFELYGTAIGFRWKF